MIAASETGMSTKTGVREGSVLMDQRWLQWVNKLLTMYQTRHSEPAPIGKTRFQNSARSAKTKSVECVHQCHKIRLKQSPCGRLPLSPAPAPRQSGNTRSRYKKQENNAPFSKCEEREQTQGTDKLTKASVDWRMMMYSSSASTTTKLMNWI